MQALKDTEKEIVMKSKKSVTLGIVATVLSAQALALEPRNDHTSNSARVSSLDEIKADEIVQYYPCIPHLMTPMCN